jgi:hypothetical protein
MPLSVHRIVILFTIAAAGVSEIKHWAAVHVKSDRRVLRLTRALRMSLWSRNAARAVRLAAALILPGGGAQNKYRRLARNVSLNTVASPKNTLTMQKSKL